MQIHNLKRQHPNKKSQLVGRGGRRGKTSGRGGKGQTARSGHKMRPEIRDFIKRIPKLRGRGKNKNVSIQDDTVVVNISRLSNFFQDNDMVNPRTLVEKKIIKTHSGVMPRVKILGDGDISKKINVSKCLVSLSAKEKILRAGGSIA